MIIIEPPSPRQASIALIITLMTCLGSVEAKAQSSKKDPPSETGSKLQRRVDFTQADLMLDFLNSLAKSNPNPGIVDSILGAKGTDLIIKQMNLRER